MGCNCPGGRHKREERKRMSDINWREADRVMLRTEPCYICGKDIDQRTASDLYVWAENPNGRGYIRAHAACAKKVQVERPDPLLDLLEVMNAIEEDLHELVELVRRDHELYAPKEAN